MQHLHRDEVARRSLAPESMRTDNAQRLRSRRAKVSDSTSFDSPAKGHPRWSRAAACQQARTVAVVILGCSSPASIDIALIQ